MSEFSLDDLRQCGEKSVKVNFMGEYNPEHFWGEYGKIYRKCFRKDAKTTAKTAALLNLEALIGRIAAIQETVKIESVLEVGCGFGRCLPFVLENCSLKEIYGIEFSPTMVEDSKSFLEEYGRVKDIKVIEGNAKNLPFPDKSFDLVYTHVCLTHIPPKDIPQVTKEISRVAKKIIVHIERFAYEYEHPNPHRWSHHLPPLYLDMGWEIVDYDTVNKEHFTKGLTLKKRGEVS